MMTFMGKIPGMVTITDSAGNLSTFILLLGQFGADKIRNSDVCGAGSAQVDEGK